MESKSLILVGGGGHCKSVIEAAESAGFDIYGVLDVTENVGRKICSYDIIGTDDDIPKYAKEYCFIVTVGFIKNSNLRVSIHNKIIDAGGQFATIIASTARVSRHAAIGEGSVIMHQTFVNADAVVGKGCIINTFANIEHDAVVDDYTHISTGVMVNGNCNVGRHVFLGSQSVMVNGVSIVDNCVIAAGSVVRKNLSQQGIYVGNPAKLMVKL